MPLSERDRRTLIIGGVVLGVILVGFLLFTLLSGGGGDDASILPVPGGGTRPGGSVSETPSPTPSVSPIQNFSGRDPFSVPPILAPISTSVPTSPPTGPTGPTTSPPTSPSTTFPPTSPPPTNPGGGSSKVIGGHTVVLLDVFDRFGVTRVQVEVDGQVYNVAAGSTFAAGQFKFVSASGNCASFLFGDEAFSLCATSSK